MMACGWLAGRPGIGGSQTPPIVVLCMERQDVMDPNTPMTLAGAVYKTRPEEVEAFKTVWGPGTRVSSTTWRWRC